MKIIFDSEKQMELFLVGMERCPDDFVECQIPDDCGNTSCVECWKNAIEVEIEKQEDC